MAKLSRADRRYRAKQKRLRVVDIQVQRAINFIIEHDPIGTREIAYVSTPKGNIPSLSIKETKYFLKEVDLGIKRMGRDNILLTLACPHVILRQRRASANELNFGENWDGQKE